MKKRLNPAKGICLVLCLLLCDTAVSSAEAKSISTELIRLHVVAAQDTPEATAHKEAVRDAILEKYFTAAEGDISAEREYIREHLEDIKDLAEETLLARGQQAEVTVGFGYRELPEKEYEGFALPGGTYETLTVTIGEGEGSNWWCVLFPPLCLVPAGETKSAAGDCGMSDDCYTAITKGGTKIRLHSKILQTVKSIRKKITKNSK